MTMRVAAMVLLAAGLVGTFGCSGESPRNRRRLAEAARDGDHKRLLSLLEGGVNPDGLDSEGNSALAWAAQRCDKESTAALLQKGANPNLVLMSYYHTPSAVALDRLVSYGGRRQVWCSDGPAIGEMLLHAGANVNGTTQGNFCLAPLLRASSPEAVAFLVTHHADLNPCDGEPVASSLMDVPKALDAFLKLGGNPDIRNKRQRSALHRLTEYQGNGSEHLDAIRVLLEYRANPNLTDEAGYTPLDYAFRCNFTDAVALLKEHGAKWGREIEQDPAALAKQVERASERAEEVLERASQICQNTCTFSVVGDDMATGGTDSNWAIIQGTTGVITARCPDHGFLHYIVRTSNLKARLPRKMNLPISGQASFPITFDEEWRNGQMMWFLSKKPTDDLILAIEQSEARCAGKVDLTVAPMNGRTVGHAKKRAQEWDVLHR